MVIAAAIGLPLSALATELIVQSSACRAAPYQPAPDVNYQPGVAADGSAVAPADLSNHGSLQMNLNNLPPAYLTVDLAQRLHLPANWQSNLWQPVAVLSNENGRWLLNGQPIQPDDRAIAELCGHRP